MATATAAKRPRRRGGGVQTQTSSRSSTLSSLTAGSLDSSSDANTGSGNNLVKAESPGRGTKIEEIGAQKTLTQDDTKSADEDLSRGSYFERPLDIVEEDRPLADEARCEREARSIAIERAYVHDVYEQISQHLSDTSGHRYRAWPRVKQFLQDLEPGSILCDVGCGCGKYLDVNPYIFNIGSDRCKALTQIAREKEHEVMLCDNLNLPFRDESLDAVLSVAVIHHVATAERRVRALRELARVVRVGGRVMISVWAMEQRHRKFGSQDVLIPWHKPPPSNGGGIPGGSISSGKGHQTATYGSRRSLGSSAQLHPPGSAAATGCTTTTTTTTSEDDVTHYYAYTQTTTSDSGDQCNNNFGSARSGLRRRHRNTNRKGRSMDPGAHDIFVGQSGEEFYTQPLYQSSSELSSPNSETCYSFVRKAIQKLSVQNRRQAGTCGSTGRPANRVPWFNLAGGLEHWVGQNHAGDVTTYDMWHETDGRRSGGRQDVAREDSGESVESIGDLPIELPHLEGDLGVDHQMLWSSFVLERRKMDPNFTLNGKSKSLDDLIPSPSEVAAKKSKNISLLEMGRANTYDDQTALDRERRAELDYILFRGGHVRAQVKAEQLEEGGRRDQGEEEEEEDDDEFPEEDEIELAVSGILRDLKKTLSASLRSLSIRSGSLTSISSGKSMMSNFSVKSDSGINLPVAAGKQPQQPQPQTAPIPPPPSSTTAGRKSETKRNILTSRRTWDSEPMLDSSQVSPHRRSRSMNVGDVSGIGGSVDSGSFEKVEKTKVMLGIESKLMKAIKEVNESDVSENPTPVNSPFLPPPSIAARRPILIKQKRSFHVEDDEKDEEGEKSVEDKNELPTQSTIEEVKDNATKEGQERTKADKSEQIDDPEVKDISDTKNSPSPQCAKKKSGFGLSDLSFEELKLEVRRMPAVVTRSKGAGCAERGRSSSEGGVGSITEHRGDDSTMEIPAFSTSTITSSSSSTTSRQNVSKNRQKMRQQFSLNDELLSRDRLQANQEVRKRIRKQQSLPDEGRSEPKKHRTLRESFLMAVKTKTFENLKNSFSLFRVPEEEDANAGATEKNVDEDEDEDESTRIGAKEEQIEELKEHHSNVEQTGKIKDHHHTESVPSIRTGIARILQSWRSSDSSSSDASGSFTQKRGVTIQPINVSGSHDGCGGISATPPPSSANRRSIFQRRLVGGSSPISPKQLEALTKENVDNLSPTFRRCCMDCPGGDIVRERKMSRSEASDSSKDGSIQSDTSIDSEDSCVSVIFVPHPENRLVQVEQLGAEAIFPSSDSLPPQRSMTSNSSESSESVHSAGSGRGSPLSPGNRLGSPVKGGNGKTVVVLKASSSPLRPGVTLQHETQASRNSRDDDLVFLDRPLEKIDERQESESENEDVKHHETSDVTVTPLEVTSPYKDVTPNETHKVEEEETEILETVISECNKGSDVAKAEGEDEEPMTPTAPVPALIEKTSPERTVAKLQRRLSEHKSFEMEDIPSSGDNGNPILCHPASLAQRRHLPPQQASTNSRESSKSRFDYPIVRHHPLFAKQRRDGSRSNFSSLLLGENVRIIRRRGPFDDKGRNGTNGGGSSQQGGFEIFNPETDDLDSEDENDDDDDDDDDEDEDHSSSDSSSQESVVSAPNKSENEKLEMMRQTQSLDDPTQHQGGSTSDDGLLDPEIKLRSDRRRISLMSLLDENQSVISNIAEKRRKKLGQQQTLSIDEDLESIKSDSSDVIKLSLIKEDDVFADLDVTPTAATGAVPKNRATVILPSIVVPPSSGSQRGRLGKARSVSPSSSAAKERLQLNVKRQSSVPLRFEDSELNRTIINESNKLFVTTTSINNNNNHLQHQTGENGDRERKVTLAHLEVSPSGSEISGVTRSSRESLSGGCGSKSPSPSRLSDQGTSAASADSLSKANLPDSSLKGHFRSGGNNKDVVGVPVPESVQRKRRVSGPASTRKSSLEPSGIAKSEDGAEVGKSFEEARDHLEEGFFPPCRPSGGKRISCREDSVESSGGKSSVHYSDTSSLLSHRFSTISISSNVSSEVSSSCYLASMSSADFDDRPVIASSISLDDADGDNDYHPHPVLPPQQHQQQHRTHHERMRRLKSLFRRTNPNTSDLVVTSELVEEQAAGEKKQAVLKESECEEDSVMSGIAESSCLHPHHGRSRIGTETSVENPTCIENPDRSNSFEEELFRGLPRDDGNGDNDEDDDVLMSDEIKRSASQRLSAASSSESLNSEGGGGSLIHHRYYHVFREGELDYLINTYVDNLHIISSYYDHANWCIIAEKVNVWTI